MLTRRQFIKRSAVWYGSLLLLPACQRESLQSHYRCLSVEEVNCLECICEQFIPEDEYSGARNAGVVNYIDKLLYQRFPELIAHYKTGIRMLETYCRNTFNKCFSGLSWEEQFKLLQTLETGEVDVPEWTASSQRDFFHMVLRNTMQGYYGSPRHGGNKNYISYRMMRLDFPLLIGQNRYE